MYSPTRRSEATRSLFFPTQRASQRPTSSRLLASSTTPRLRSSFRRAMPDTRGDFESSRPAARSPLQVTPPWVPPTSLRHWARFLSPGKRHASWSRKGLDPSAFSSKPSMASRCSSSYRWPSSRSSGHPRRPVCALPKSCPSSPAICAMTPGRRRLSRAACPFCSSHCEIAPQWAGHAFDSTRGKPSFEGNRRTSSSSSRTTRSFPVPHSRADVRAGPRRTRGPGHRWRVRRSRRLSGPTRFANGWHTPMARRAGLRDGSTQPARRGARQARRRHRRRSRGWANGRRLRWIDRVARTIREDLPRGEVGPRLAGANMEA